MSRSSLSRPMRMALDAGLLDSADTTTIFDYGCGRGDDLRLLRKRGFEAHGWDPVSQPGAPLVEADVVNLGYVVNVIADPSERAGALRRAWSLARRALVVSARLTAEMTERL